jgi:hypothetical protein
MNDWTPTTAAIRKMTVDGYLDYPGAMTDDELGAAFDRWLAERMKETVAAIVSKVRLNCTLDWEVMKAGGDPIIYAVADWIENPPEWVKAPWATPVPSDAGSDRG